MLIKELKTIVGELGLARSGLRFIKSKNNRGILQINHNALNETKTALSLINNINNEKVNIRTLKVSGVLNKLKQAI